MVNTYGEITLSLSACHLNVNMWLSISRFISSGGIIASHRMLEIGLVLQAPMLSRMPWLRMEFNDCSIDFDAAS